MIIINYIITLLNFIILYINYNNLVPILFSKKSIENKVINNHLKTIKRNLLHGNPTYHFDVNTDKSILDKIKSKLEKKNFKVKILKDEIAYTFILS